jgi:hypothetical protein
MARKKHRDDDDDRNIDEPEEEAAPDDAVEVDEEPADAPTALDDEPPADEPAADDRPPDEPEDEEAEEAERPPRARTPVFTIVLLVLNLLAAPPFLILLVMNYSARAGWSYATLMNRVGAYGLPLADEEDAASATFNGRQRLRVDSEELKKAYGKRPHPGASVNEPFVPVETVEEPVEFRIRPSQIDDRVQTDLFKGLGPKVATLDAEVQRVKSELPRGIEEAVTKYVSEQKDKKAAVERLLLPMAWSARQVDQLQRRIDAAAEQGKLDDLLKDAVERRMLADFLAPINIYHPEEGVTFDDLPKDDKNKGEYKKFTVEKIADLDDYSIQDLRELVQKRFDDALRAKDDIEKRHQIAFLLVAASQLRAPEAKAPLFENQFRRAQVVCGLFEFTQAAANYPRTLDVLRNRVLHAIEVDRTGYLVKKEGDKEPTGTLVGFVNNLNADIENLRKVKADIDFTVGRIKQLEAQRDRYEKEYNQRLALVTDITKKLVAERAKTAEEHAKLKRLQEELFEAQTYLSDAADRNIELLRQIDKTEKALLPKGVKKR